jgi:UDP-N-acetylmuramate dehydrogenase
MLKVRERVPLSGYTTLGLGGPAARFIEAASDEQVVTAVREADRTGSPVLVLGRGSNLVVADEGFAGTVVHVTSRGIVAAPDSDSILLAVAAGEDWDPLVESCIGQGLSGLECLSGIPGLAGATPIQNVSAYGQEVAETIAAVRAYDRRRDTVIELSNAECGFGYRTSAFKRSAAGLGAAGLGAAGLGAATGRFVVLGVTFRLCRARLSAPVRYAELAGQLGVAVGERVPLADARDAALGLRRGKGMVLDPADPDTRSAGSFFTNPVLDRQQFAELERVAAARNGPEASVPQFAGEAGQVKVPAAWLIEQAGFPKGYAGGVADTGGVAGVARISSKHTLALTNPGGASTASLVALAREIIAGVHSVFGVLLTNEPVLVGVAI